MHSEIAIRSRPADGILGTPARLLVSEAEFATVCALIKRLSGIALSSSKREMVQGRLSRRIRELGMSSCADYLELLRSGDADEQVAFCNALTTNLTSFFREAHHFRYLREQVLAPLAMLPRPGPRVRIWSAACSTGEEPYSIAMTVAETLPDWKFRDIRILATDIDSDVLQRARGGVYRSAYVTNLSAQRLATHFKRVESDAYEISNELSGMITFKRLNLMESFPMRGPIDAIFCRNVVIYFDKETQRDLFSRISQLQRTNDLLFIGHSETLFRVSEDYALVGQTIYRRVGE